MENWQEISMGEPQCVIYNRLLTLWIILAPLAHYRRSFTYFHNCRNLQASKKWATSNFESFINRSSNHRWDCHVVFMVWAEKAKVESHGRGRSPGSVRDFRIFQLRAVRPLQSRAIYWWFISPVRVCVDRGFLSSDLEQEACELIQSEMSGPYRAV